MSKITISEALKRLEVLSLLEEIDWDRLRESTSEESAVVPGEWDDFIQKENDKLINKIKEQATSPEDFLRFLTEKNTLEENIKKEPSIGDIAVLKVKLNHEKRSKFIYDGCERKPVLILDIKGDYVKGLEIAHSETFKNNPLINIGRINENDSKDSYINIYAQQDNLPLSYEFPLEFDEKTHKPKTKGDILLEYFGKVYLGKDSDEPFLVEFNYKTNFKKELNIDKLIEILSKLKKGE